MGTVSYGAWTSPITAAALVDGAVGINEVVPDGRYIWWTESRPTEGGRAALMRSHVDGGDVVEITPADANVRTRVHEYGGGSWWAADGVAYYVDYADQRLRRLEPGADPEFLTPEPVVAGAFRFADGRVSPDGKWFVCVRETHGVEGSEAVNDIVAVATDGSERVQKLAGHTDFVSAPRLAPDGRSFVWISWDHPYMPWDNTELHIADFDHETGSASNHRLLVGNGDEALQQPEWYADGTLHVVSDRSEWWNLYGVDPATGDLTAEITGDFEIVTPHWVFGLSRYAEGVHVEPGVSGDQLSTGVATPYTTISSLRRSGNVVSFVGASYGSEAEVAVVRDGTCRVVRPARDLGLDPAFFSPPEPISFATTNDATAHALFYAPANPDVEAEAERRELPPLIVAIHGGPTSAARKQLSLGHRFWTSRGFAVVDVDYRGSTGYGRTYRHALNGQWGVADVDDAVAAAQYLANRGEVDPERLLIRGGSAGGFTTLAALAFHDVFAAGASHYGVADLAALAADTHKFESRYLDGMVGPYPEAADLYAARSPINHTDQLNAPMIVLQGDEDEVVPPAQSEMIVAALRERGVPVAYLLFAGEQHGFRRAENIVRALEAELSFYGQVLGFDPADEIEPVPLE